MDKNFIESLIASQTVGGGGGSGEDDVARGLAAAAQTAAENAQSTADSAQSTAEKARDFSSPVMFMLAGTTLAVSPAVFVPNNTSSISTQIPVNSANVLNNYGIIRADLETQGYLVDSTRFVGTYASSASTLVSEPVSVTIDIQDISTFTGTITLKIGSYPVNVVGTMTNGAITWAAVAAS